MIKPTLLITRNTMEITIENMKMTSMSACFSVTVHRASLLFQPKSLWFVRFDSSWHQFQKYLFLYINSKVVLQLKHHFTLNIQKFNLWKVSAINIFTDISGSTYRLSLSCLTFSIKVIIIWQAAGLLKLNALRDTNISAVHRLNSFLLQNLPTCC